MSGGAWRGRRDDRSRRADQAVAADGAEGAAWAQSWRVTRRPLGHQRGRAAGDHQDVLRLRAGTLGQRRAGRGAHAALPAGVDVVPVPVRAHRAARPSAEHEPAPLRVCGAVGPGDAAGQPEGGCERRE